MLKSMTGFARQETQQDWGQLICEIRSVNQRYLDTNVKLSDALRSLEPQLRQQLKGHIARGKIEIGLYLTQEEQGGQNLDLNKDLASKIISLAAEVDRIAGDPAPLDALEVLRWPGVLKSNKVDPDVLEAAALQTFQKALQQLLEHRQREGSELKQFIQQRLTLVAEHVNVVRDCLPEIQARHAEKLQARLAALEVDVDQDRLAQELVFVAQKIDVAEELDRLEAHLLEVGKVLQQQEPVGRRLDFLMQELNREANTLSSKSIATQTTQSAVDLKVLIEQMREQVQNIE